MKSVYHQHKAHYKMKKHILFAFLLLGFFSCKEDKKAEATTENSQMKEVMAIHDEVMPKMGNIGKLVATLKSEVDSTAQGIEYEKAMIDLQEGNKAMMDWMQGFGDRFDSDEIMKGKMLSEEKKQWLNEEEDKIKAVRDQINSGIEMPRSCWGKVVSSQ